MRIGAIDQGTTSTRILVAEGQSVRIAAVLPHATRYPRPGWVEQDALELIGNIERCIAEAGQLDALGLANQGESCLAWDGATGEPLTPIVVWQDNRTAKDLQALPPALAERVTALSFLPLDAYFSASKLGWIVRNVPAAREALAAGRLRLGTTDAFFHDRLGGRFVTDRATASRTALMNFRTGEWDAELCSIFGVPIGCLPAILPNIGDFGVMRGIPVRAAIVDQQASLYGHGCRMPGEGKITFGTGGFALVLTEGPVVPEAAGGLLPTVAWDLGEGTSYALDGGIYDVGSAIDWAIRAGIAEGVADFDHFAAPPAIDRGLVFVPAFSGLAAPLWDRSAVPIITGLTPEMSRRDLCQALIEGIALSAAGIMAAFAGATPLSGALRIDGGVSRSGYFVDFLSACLGREVLVRGFGDQTALGVAALVARATGATIPGTDDADRRFAAPPRPDRLASFLDIQRRGIGLRQQD